MIIGRAHEHIKLQHELSDEQYALINEIGINVQVKRYRVHDEFNC